MRMIRGEFSRVAVSAKMIKKQTRTRKLLPPRQTCGRGDNQLLMKSATESRATWVRGVKFGAPVVHAAKKTIKVPTVVSPAKLIFEGNVCRNFHHSPLLSPQLLQPSTCSRKSCIVLQLHLLKALCNAGCFCYYSYSVLLTLISNCQIITHHIS